MKNTFLLPLGAPEKRSTRLGWPVTHCLWQYPQATFCMSTYGTSLILIQPLGLKYNNAAKIYSSKFSDNRV